MFTDTFKKVLDYEGVVSITSWGADDPHVTCTWNSYLVLKGNKRLLLPVAGMHSTEEDLSVNPKLIITLGSRQVEGFNGYQGTGFRVLGIGKLVNEGAEFEEMKAKFPFLRSVLEVTVTDAKQLL
ncbi:pyridoxamine 5'-phosphate oxidase family protein [Streptococcus sp. H49]|uniref:pyridoxamine 5'-phosphate oxidase family protein n=1 Tax=Streptococcus huangxiaojuni TaxID=3237239 RepID=UPI0034A2E4E0